MYVGVVIFLILLVIIKRQNRLMKKRVGSTYSAAESQLNMLDIINKNGNIQCQMQALTKTFKQYSEQNKKLTQLYQITKTKNQDLAKINAQLGKDLTFLKQYCSSLEHQLQRLGFYKHQHGQMLSRKETAEGIFVSYNQSTLSLADNSAYEDSYSELRQRILILQNENRLLKQQLQTQISKTTRSMHKPHPETEKQDVWLKAYQASEQRVTHLQNEIKEVRKLNYALEYEKQKKGITSFIMKDRGQVFNNIHRLISEYKKKINGLAHEKKEVQKKYKQLKEKVSRLDQSSEYKLIQLYSEKIQVLQKLTQKQQTQIQNTIDLYEVQLTKIQEKRREEIQFFENERLDLQTQNLKLCIDLQKSLNHRDQAALQLAQQKNKNQILLQEIIELRNAIQSYKKREIQRKNLKAQANCVDICIANDCKSKLASPSSSFIKSSSQHSNLQNIEYQFSEISEKRSLIERIQQVSLKRQNSLSKKTIRDKITITYGQPYMIKPYYANKIINKPKNMIGQSIPSSPSNMNKSYDSVIEYKKRFIERKPQSNSFNQ